MEKQNSQCEHRKPIRQQETCFAHANQVWLTVNHNNIFTSGELFQVSQHIASVNHICVIHETMNGCKKNLKIP